MLRCWGCHLGLSCCPRPAASKARSPHSASVSSNYLLHRKHVEELESEWVKKSTSSAPLPAASKARSPHSASVRFVVKYLMNDKTAEHDLVVQHNTMVDNVHEKQESLTNEWRSRHRYDYTWWWSNNSGNQAWILGPITSHRSLIEEYTSLDATYRPPIQSDIFRAQKQTAISQEVSIMSPWSF